MQRGDAVYQVVVRSLKFRCKEVDVRTAHSAWLWAATKTGQADAYQMRREQEGMNPEDRQLEKQIKADVTRVLAEPAAEQTKWIKKQLDTCQANPS
jgi:hypothetical protein